MRKSRSFGTGARLPLFALRNNRHSSRNDHFALCDFGTQPTHESEASFPAPTPKERSAPGQIRKSGRATGQSALPSRTDVASRACQVRKVPIPDLHAPVDRGSARSAFRGMLSCPRLQSGRCERKRLPQSPVHRRSSGSDLGRSKGISRRPEISMVIWGPRFWPDFRVNGPRATTSAPPVTTTSLARALPMCMAPSCRRARSRTTCRDPLRGRRIDAGHTVAMQSTSTSNGPCHPDTNTKLRAGGSDEK
jgi:hypothetical protein